MDDAFWNITLSTPSQDSGLDEEPRRSKDQQKDPINTFKAFRHIFNEEIENPREAKNRKQQRRKSREEDFLDIYADWASSVLDDERIEKKRSKRGRVPAAKNRHPVRILFCKKELVLSLELVLFYFAQKKKKIRTHSFSPVGWPDLPGNGEETGHSNCGC